MEEGATFAAQYGITYPLLADVDSTAIRATGILNELAAPGMPINFHKVAPVPLAEAEGNMGQSHYGVPYPGSYLIGNDGRVIEKLFYRHYRTRASVATVLRSGFGVDFEVRENPRAEVADEGVRIRATLGGESMVFMETALLYVEIDLDPRLHLYGQPVPDGYVATEVTVTGPDSVVVGEASYPPTEPFEVAGLEEEFQVFRGAVQIAVPIYYVREDFNHLLARARSLERQLEEPGNGVVRQLMAHAKKTRPPEVTEVHLDVSVRYQACTDVACLPPQTRELQLAVPIVELSRPTYHTSAAK